jgi:16S rRNA (uracil1498-N3)-methyltransferase
MRSTRIYFPKLLQVGETFELDELAAHHVISVLRFKLGEEFIVFDGHDHEYVVQITKIFKKHLELNVLTVHDICRESHLKLHLAQGIAKGERWTYSLQKAVELGVSEITPLWTQHVSYKWDKKVDDKKFEQWQAILISACEQSGRTQVPQLNPITTFQDFIKSLLPKNRVILHPGQVTHWKQLSWQSNEGCVVLIGPEGGFSVKEYEQAQEHEFQGLSLGPRILRTETAVVSALSLLQALYGDL